MEHRWTMRKPVHGHVTLRYPPLGLQQAEIEDISLGGLFVNTEPTAGLDINTRVELSFSPRGRTTRRIEGVEALVVRKTAHGAGLMFRNFNSATFRMLRTLLLEDEQGEPGRS